MARYDFNFPQDTAIALKLGSGSTITLPKRIAPSMDDGLTLELTRTDLQVAPDFVGLWVTPTTQRLPQLSGLTVYDRHFHEDWYEVDWGDAGCSDYITGETIAAWGHRNLSLHRRSGHVYERPGTYTITVSRYNAAGVLLSQAKRPVTINDPDVMFDADHTCAVSKVSDWTDAPAHKITRGELVSALDWASSQTRPVRISVHAGEVFTMDNRIIKGYPNLYIDTYGTGPKPVMKAAASGSVGLLRVYEQKHAGSVIAGFVLQGNWDSTTEHVIPGTTAHGEGLRAYGDGFLIVHDCDASGFGTAFGSMGETALTKVVVSQSTITNWQDYGIYIGSANGNQAWLLGVRINQHVDALSGGRGKVSGAGYVGNDHGPLRCQCDHLVMEGLEMFSRNAWTAAAVADDQDPMRLHMNNTYKTICGNRILGEGGLKFYAGGAAAGGVTKGMNIRMTSLIHLGGYPSTRAVDISNGGTTLENLLAIRSDNPVATGTQTNGTAISFGGVNTAVEEDATENNISPVRVRNPTVINLTSDKNTVNRSGSHVTFNPVTGPGHLANVEVTDVAEYTVRTNSAHDDGPFDRVALREPLYKGQRFGYEYVESTVPVSVPPGGEMTLPYPAGTTPSDYFAAGWTQIVISGAGTLDTRKKQVAVVFGPGAITVANLTTTTWTAGRALTAKFDRRLSPGPFTQATPAGSYHLYHPASGNTALVGGATGTNVPRRDLLMRVRPAKPAKGALEPL